MKYLQVLIVLVALLSASATKAEKSISIVTTIRPVHALVSGVMASVTEPLLLVDGITSPHSYALKPSQRKALETADIVFLIDQKFELFLASALKDLPKNVQVIPLIEANNISTLERRQYGEHHNEESKDEGHHNHHDHHQHAKDDPHIWLNPQNAIAMTYEIARQLSFLNPDKQDIYNQNAQKQVQKLKVLDETILKQLSDVQQKPFMVFHDAYQYFEKRYGLESVGSLTLEPDQNVSIKHVQKVRRNLMAQNVRCVFREPQFSDKLVQTVIEGTDVKSSTLDPIGTDIPLGPDLYEQLLLNMSDSITNCLKSDA